MRRKENLIGKKFDRLVVIEEAEDAIMPSGQRASRWLCKCDCGNTVIVRGVHLKSGHTRSCGCMHDEVASIHCKNDFAKTNTYTVENGYIVGLTNKGNRFFVDLDDYDKIKRYCWTENTRGYLENLNVGLLHRFIMQLGVYGNDNRYVVDHINHNYLDNRKANLRVCKQQENSFNSKTPINNTSGIKGVFYMKDRGKWRATIGYDKKAIYIGDYTTKEEAIKARKDAENIYQKEFSYDNSMIIASEKEVQS